MAGSVPETRRGGRWIVAALAVALLAAIAGVTFVASATGPAPPPVRTASTVERSDPPAAARTRARAPPAAGASAAAARPAAARAAPPGAPRPAAAGADAGGAPAGTSVVIEIRDEDEKVLTWAPIEKAGRFAFIGPPVATNPADASDVRIIARSQRGETQFRTLARDVAVRLPEDWYARHDLRLRIPPPVPVPVAQTRQVLRVVWQDGTPARGVVITPVGEHGRTSKRADFVAGQGAVVLRDGATAQAFDVFWGLTPGERPFHTFRAEEAVDGTLVIPFAPPATVKCQIVDSTGAGVPGLLVSVRWGDDLRANETREPGQPPAQSLLYRLRAFETGPDGKFSFRAPPLGHAYSVEGVARPPIQLTRDGTAADGSEVWVLPGAIEPNVTFRFRDPDGAIVAWRSFEGRASRSVVADRSNPEVEVWMPPGPSTLIGRFTFEGAPPLNASTSFSVRDDGPTVVDVVAGSSGYLLVDLGITYFDGAAPTGVGLDATPNAVRPRELTMAQSRWTDSAPRTGLPVWTAPGPTGRFVTWLQVKERQVVLWVRAPLANGRFGPYVLDPERRKLQLDVRLPRPPAYLGRVVDASGKPRPDAIVAHTSRGSGVPRWGEYSEILLSNEGFFLIPFADAPDGIDLWWIEDRMADDGRATRTLHSLARDVRPDENAGILELVVPGPVGPSR